MYVALVIVSKGVINNVKFYDDVSVALQELADHVKSMNKNEDDAAVYDSDGLVTNAKELLEKGNASIDEAVKGIITDKKKETIYIIADPFHSLGFMVIGYPESVGYKNPIKALVTLEKLRKEQGIHVKLYRAELIAAPVTKRDTLETINIKKNRVDFEYPLVDEYLA